MASVHISVNRKVETAGETQVLIRLPHYYSSGLEGCGGIGVLVRNHSANALVCLNGPFWVMAVDNVFVGVPHVAARLDRTGYVGV